MNVCDLMRNNVYEYVTQNIQNSRYIRADGAFKTLTKYIVCRQLMVFKYFLDKGLINDMSINQP